VDEIEAPADKDKTKPSRDTLKIKTPQAREEA
jgi:hypothetical protein